MKMRVKQIIFICGVVVLASGLGLVKTAQAESVTLTSLSFTEMVGKVLTTRNVDTVYINIRGGGGGPFAEAMRIIKLTKGMKVICVRKCVSSAAFIVMCRDDYEIRGEAWVHAPILPDTKENSPDGLKWLAEHCPQMTLDLSVTKHNIGWKIRGNTERLTKWED